MIFLFGRNTLAGIGSAVGWQSPHVPSNVRIPLELMITTVFVQPKKSKLKLSLPVPGKSSRQSVHVEPSSVRNSGGIPPGNGTTRNDSSSGTRSLLQRLKAAASISPDRAWI